MSIRVTYHFGDNRPPLVEVVAAQNVSEAATIVAAQLLKPEGFLVADLSEPSRGTQSVRGREVHGIHLCREHEEMGQGAGEPGLLTDASEQKLEWLRSVGRHEPTASE